MLRPKLYLRHRGEMAAAENRCLDEGHSLSVTYVVKFVKLWGRS
jgi:hypothetical protein